MAEPGNISGAHRTPPPGSPGRARPPCRIRAAKEVPHTVHTSSLDRVARCRTPGTATWARPRPVPSRGSRPSTGRGRQGARGFGLGCRPWQGRRSTGRTNRCVGGDQRAAAAGHRCSAGTAHRRQGSPPWARRNEAGFSLRPGSQPASRSAICGHACARSTRARPASPILRARPGSASSVPTAAATASTSVPSTRIPVSPSTSASRAPPESPTTTGTPARGGLDEDVAPPLHLEPAQPGAARHREHVAHRVVPRQVLLRYLPREEHGAGRRVSGEPAQRAVVRPRPHDEERGVGHGSPHVAHAADQHVLTLARDEPAHAHDERPLADPVALAEVASRGRDGRPQIGARVQHRDGHAVGDRGANGPRDELAAHHRHAGRARGRRSASGRAPPARPRASTRTRARRSGRACRRRRARAPAGRAGRSPRTARPRRPSSARRTRRAARPRGRPQDPLGLAEHRIGLGGVEDLGALAVGAEHADPLGRKLMPQRLEGPLDPAHARREVVRDQQRPGIVHRADNALQERWATRDGRRRHEAPQDELEALEEGRAFFDLSAYRKVRVTGADARAWLHDLVTSDVASLEPGDAQRSLLLTPTGRIRADLTVALDAEGFLLLQAPDQPDDVGPAAAAYVLSSDVSLERRHDDLAAVCSRRCRGRLGLGCGPLIGPGDGPRHAGADAGSSRLGADALPRSGGSLEAWRRRRAALDFGQDALPAEAGLDWTIDTAKGCFLGQESVARVRNLGHPLLGSFATSIGPRNLERGSPVMAGGSPVGEVTSAAVAGDGRTVAIARSDGRRRRPWSRPRTASGARTDRPEGLARSGDFVSLHRGFGECVPSTPSVGPARSVMNRVPRRHPAARGRPRGGDREDRPVSGRRPESVAAGSHPARPLAGSRRVLRRRPRRLLPHLRGGGRARPSRSAAAAGSARNASPGR